MIHQARQGKRSYCHLNGPDGAETARLTIDHVTMRVGGGAEVSVAAVGNVLTAEAARGQGLAATLMEAVPQLAPEAAMAVLFGIDNYYLRFGYRDAGDEWATEFHALGAPSGQLTIADISPLDDSSVAAAQTLERLRQGSLAGTVDRDGAVWRVLAGEPEFLALGASRQGRLVGAFSGRELRATAWLAPDHDVARGVQSDLDRPTLFVNELIADSPEAGHELLAHLADGSAITLAAHPNSVGAKLAEVYAARVTKCTRPTGGAMALVLRQDDCREAGLPTDSEGLCSELKARSFYVPLADRW